MKRFIGALIMSLACLQSVHAVSSNLQQSIREYEAILESSLLPEAISQAEVIFDLERRTRDLAATTVIYEITTRLPRGIVSSVELTDEIEEIKARSPCCDNQRFTVLRYRVVLELTPNPEIGPLIITVVSITPVSRSLHTILTEEEEVKSSVEEEGKTLINEAEAK